MGLLEASPADGELLIVCSDILRRWCVTLGFKFGPNAQPMHNLCSYHQKVVAMQTKEVSRSFFLFFLFFSCVCVCVCVSCKFSHISELKAGG